MKISISIFGRDEPGVIATLTSCVKDIGANIEDASMTLLQGFFAMIMVVHVEEGQEIILQNELHAKDELNDYVVNITKVKPLQETKKVDHSLKVQPGTF